MRARAFCTLCARQGGELCTCDVSNEFRTTPSCSKTGAVFNWRSDRQLVRQGCSFDQNQRSIKQPRPLDGRPNEGLVLSGAKKGQKCEEMFKSKSTLKNVWVKAKESDLENDSKTGRFCGHCSQHKGQQLGLCGSRKCQKPEDSSSKKLGFLKTVVERVKSTGSASGDQNEGQQKKSLQQSLAELKLDLPRVQSINGTTVSESSLTPGSKNIGTTQNIPRIQSQFHQDILKNGAFQSQQPFQRNYVQGQERSRQQLLKATISHKIGAGRKETVYTAWDNHQPASAVAFEGPKSLPVVDVPRAPIPTPDALTDCSCPGDSPSAKTGAHYQFLNDRDGDYSYVYDSSLSPAFIIKYNEEDDDESQGVDEGCDTPKSKVENIYEEICEDRDNSSRGSNGSDSGIGGLEGAKGVPKFSQGTLDVVSPKKKVLGGEKVQKSPAEEKLGALDRLLFQTAPGMTATQRRDLRKSLVDEVFEELVKRHHDRVLNQLKLDVEDFINPGAEQKAKENDKQNNLRQSFNQKSGRKLKKCESMDFKEAVSTGSNSRSSSFKRRRSCKRKGSADAGHYVEKDKKDPLTQRLFGKAAFLANAKKYSEAFNRKYFGRNKNEPAEEPERRLSALLSVSTNSFDLLDKSTLSAKKLSSYRKTCSDLDDDSDSSDRDRRLRRSEIIQSFLEQSTGSDTECNNNEETACTHI